MPWGEAKSATTSKKSGKLMVASSTALSAWYVFVGYLNYFLMHSFLAIFL